MTGDCLVISENTTKTGEGSKKTITTGSDSGTTASSTNGRNIASFNDVKAGEIYMINVFNTPTIQNDGSNRTYQLAGTSTYTKYMGQTGANQGSVGDGNHALCVKILTPGTFYVQAKAPTGYSRADTYSVSFVKIA